MAIADAGHAAYQATTIMVDAPDGSRVPALLSVTDAAITAGVSRRTIYNWIARKQIELVYTASGMPRVVTLSLWRR